MGSQQLVLTIKCGRPYSLFTYLSKEGNLIIYLFFRTKFQVLRHISSTVYMASQVDCLRSVIGFCILQSFQMTDRQIYHVKIISLTGSVWFIWSIHCSRRGKDQLPAAEFLHHFQQGHGAVQIISIISKRLFYTFSHSFETCKMDHSIDPMMNEHLLQTIFIGTIHPIELRSSSTDLLNAV